jgi:hypothetical protein
MLFIILNGGKFILVFPRAKFILNVFLPQINPVN